jgi:DNA-binding NarL/FixJ family response regulator
MNTQLLHPSLILADDHRMFAESLAASLARLYEIRGTAFSASELHVLLEHSKADCLLLDLLLPDANGLELIPRTRAMLPQMKILVVTMLLDRVLADAAFAAGAHGFVPKDASMEELTLAISEVLAGRLYRSPRLPKSSHRVGMRARHAAIMNLTPRQQEIVLMLGEGKSELRIAHTLGLSPSTVTFHKQNILRILGLETSAALTRLAVLVRASAANDQLATSAH